MLRSPQLTLVVKEYNHELRMVDVDGQPSECSADIFLEHHEIAAAREAPPYDAEEQSLVETLQIVGPINNFRIVI